jgi:hypothetical protein
MSGQAPLYRGTVSNLGSSANLEICSGEAMAKVVRKVTEAMSFIVEFLY